MARTQVPSPWLVRFAKLSTIGLFIVVLMGFVVTDTNSGRGCGGSWPLCHGQFIPQFAVSTLIEFSHRAVTGIVGVMVVVLALWAWRQVGDRTEVRAFAAIGVGFVFVQALLGAADVLWPESPTVLALHFGFSLIAFGGVVLLTAVLIQLASPSSPGRFAMRERVLPRGMRPLIWLSLIYLYGLVYLGALVAHTNAGLACNSWPLCQGTLVPALHGLVLINYAHRIAALLAVMDLLWLFLRARRIRQERPDIYRAAHVALALVLLQAISGAILVFTRIDLFAQLLHVGLMTVLFSTIAYACLQTLPVRVRARSATALL